MAQVKVDKALTEGLTKKERREVQREYARAERERLARARRRQRITGWIVGPVAVLAVLAVVAVAVVTTVRAGLRGPNNMITDGLLLTGSGDGSTVTASTTDALSVDEQPIVNTSSIASSGVLDLQIYADPTSADTATFWSTDGSAIDSYLTQAAISLELHPVATTGSDDAVAAVSGFACVADTAPDSAFAFWKGMLQIGIDNAGTDGSGKTVTAADLVTVATNASITDTDVQKCISGQGFATWARSATDRAEASIPYADTATTATAAPVIVAAGQVYTGALDDADAFSTFLGNAYSAATASSESTDGSTPAPSDSATPTDGATAG